MSSEPLFDINEIVLLTYLERLNIIDESVKGYSHILHKHIDAYPKRRKAVFEAKSLIESPLFDTLSVKSREKHFEQLEVPVNNLRTFIDSFDEVSDMAMDEIQQLKNQNVSQERSDTLSQRGIWIAVISAIVGALVTFFCS